MKMSFFKQSAALMIFGALLMGTAEARTADPDSKPHKAKVKKTKTVFYEDHDPYLHGSKETVRQRERRLSRECRGAVNAGACAGYTR